ncbi:MAG: LysE family translocator [Pseudomonadales bacterium]|nr:LysE family translocator [Pseudomonadales bacterium]NRA17913.1 LysE family translocator [Oceanospirillaceae bacterium]
MFDLSVLPIFFTAIFFLVISPGPDLVLISSYSSSRGFKAGLMLSIGVFIAGVVQTLLVAFGLGQLMQALPVLALAIKSLGALYLAWLGCKMLKSWYENNQAQAEAVSVPAVSNLNLISKGLLNNLLNPKALLFFSLFLPQFINTSHPISMQIFILGMLLSIFALAMNMLFALFFSSLGRILGKKLKLGRHIDGLLGLIFIGLATRLATSK